MKPTDEEFIAWRENPMTQWFMAAVRNIGIRNQNEVKERAWDAATGAAHQNVDSHEINALAARALCYHDIYTADFEKIEEWQNDD